MKKITLFIILNLIPLVFLSAISKMILYGWQLTSFAEFALSLVAILMANLISLFPLAILLLPVYFLFKKITSWVSRGVILYIFYLVTFAVSSYILFTALGGVSMAHVDGGLSHSDIIRQVRKEVFKFLLEWQFSIISSIIVSIMMTKRFASGIFQKD
jgi:hypothetical protein